jgi:hypothetical protein
LWTEFRKFTGFILPGKMKRMPPFFMKRSSILIACSGCLVLAAVKSMAWDYEGHRLINQLALASLPGNFPGSVLTPTAKERIAFLAGEPDRWRNTPDLPLKHFNAPDHFLDIDDLPPYQLDPTALSPFRYEFTAQLAVFRAAQPDRFPPIDRNKDSDHTRVLVGFLPWTITEDYGKLKSAFSYLKTFEEAGGTAEEIQNAQQNVIYIMGVMGHYVGDGAQPLHTTRHYNGWVGNNPQGYTTNRTFHAWIDGGYLHKAGLKPEGLLGRVRPAKPLAIQESKGSYTNIFPCVMAYLLEQHALVEPLYQLDRDGKLSARREVSPEGYNFITGQMIKAAQMLGDLWFTAWQHAPPDTYLKAQLTRRKSAKEKTAEGEKPPP